MMLDNLPVILSLLAGLVACITTFVYRYEGTGWLLIVLGTLIVFYILGTCIKALFKVVLAEPEEEDVSADEEEMDAEEENVENGMSN